MSTLPLSLSGGSVPVESTEDVLNEFPRPHRNPESAPVRDAFVEAWTAGFKTYQEIAERAAAESDPMRASGEYLEDYAEERGVVHAKEATEDALRARLFRAPDIVAPEILVEQVNDLLALYTTKTCFLHEPDVDGLFVHDGVGEWDAFIEAAPDYPDRYYDEMPWLEPSGAHLSENLESRLLLRVPELSSIDELVPYVTDGDDGIFVSDGEDVGLYLFDDASLAEEVYVAIVGLIETIKGQGITWTLVVDPTI